MKISLVIPAYNEEKLIEQCLTAVQNSGGGKFHEVVVIDNASTDRTAEIANTFSGVRVVHESRKGLSVARNRGLQETTGDIIAYIDADCLLPSGWYELVETFFSSKKYVSCVSGPYDYYGLSTWSKRFWDISFHTSAMAYYLFRHMVIGGNFAIRREVALAMGGFNEDIKLYGEDANISRRAHRFGNVVFSRKLKMPTSPRRLVAEGMFKTRCKYGMSYFSEALLAKNVINEHTDFR